MTTVAPLADFCRNLGRPYISVDGFNGSGKSTLARTLSEMLGATLMSCDKYLPPSDSMTIESYIGRLDRERLRRDILANSKRVIVVEGVLMRDVLADLVPRAAITTIYVALCSSPTAGNLIWHSGFRLEDGDDPGAPWLDTLETDYHRRARPHEDADAIVVRID